MKARLWVWRQSVSLASSQVGQTPPSGDHTWSNQAPRWPGTSGAELLSVLNISVRSTTGQGIKDGPVHL